MRDHFRLDPFDADIPLIFAVGSLCGTSAPASSRLSVVSRSPLTGTIFSSSAGGSFAWQLKRTGIDALVVSGRSPRPVILYITPSGAVLEPADHLWGKGITQLFTALREGAGVAGIGPAGERGVLFAGIVMEDGGEAGRGGLGAVMGSKNLKALTAKGDQETSVANPERLERARQDAMRLFRASPVISGELGIGEYGTPALVDLLRVRRMTPTANFRATHFAGAVNYSGPAIRRRFSPRSEGSHDCPVQCRQRAEGVGRLPELDAVSHFGALNLIDDLETIVAANAICSDAGMDPISAAATVATLGELRGRFPDGDELLELLRQTVERTGPGELLSQGSRRFALESGAPHLSMTVKGLEIPAYDPRGAYGMALSYCTSSRGACHLGACAHSHEVLRKPVPTDRFSLSGKARIIAGGEDAYAALDSISVCPFALFAASLEEYGEMVSTVTGMEFSPRILRQAGANICLTERYYNCVNGFTIDDDILPDRFFTEGGSDGDGITVPPIDRQRFLEELRKYYAIRGLNHDGCLTDHRFLEALP
jgi:aldehyde:ferredoxin oxidoreductase